MGSFAFDKDTPYGEHITAVLARRGLKPCIDAQWDVHGPHGYDLLAHVFVGWARKVGEAAKPLVVLHAKAVYKIVNGDRSRWWDTRSENLRRIPTLKTQATNRYYEARRRYEPK
jgi:hypothetical protein